MTESEQLTEGSYVYTDLGIEQVHWCEVNGEKELVTPKGYIHGEVPSVNRHFQLVGENAILMAENTKLKETISNDIFLIKSRDSEIARLKELLKECRFLLGKTPCENTSQYLTFSDVLNRIDQVLGE